MPRTKRLISLLLAAVMLASFSFAYAYAEADSELSDLPVAVFDVYGSTMDRALVVAQVSNGVFLSWRYFPDEATGISDTGLVGTDFAVFKNGVKIADVTDSTNYLDAEGTADDSYTVVTVSGGEYISRTEAATPAPQTADGSYLSIPLQRPESVEVPSNSDPDATQTKNYAQDEVSAADVDGDGQLEFMIKWQADNFDVINDGYGSPVIFQCYELDGTLLWEINLGINIRPGQHYSQPMLYDFDGDGKAELMVKTAPGTTDGLGNYITMPQSDIDAGWSHEDDYRTNDGALNGLGVEAKETGKLFRWMVDFFENWHTQGDVLEGWWKYPPQVMMGLYPEGYVGVNGPADAEGYMGTYAAVASAVGYTQEVWDRLNALPKDPAEFKNYTITHQDAVDLTWLWWAHSYKKNGNIKLNTFNGYVIDGPEYFTVFDGATGKELDTIPYAVPRGDIGMMWNDFTGKVEPMNRVERHLGGVAYLDGEGGNASCLQTRGYYSRTTITRYDWDGVNLTGDVIVDSGFEVSNNPFKTDNPVTGPSNVHGGPGRLEESFDPENPTVEKEGMMQSITCQGQHAMSVMDVDGDGFDEIIFGGVTFNHDGSVRYASYLQRYTGTSETPNGDWEKVGHGDSAHVAYFDPEQTAPKSWMALEGAWADEVLRDADTGEVLYYVGAWRNGAWGQRDNGRAMVGKFTSESGWQLFTRGRTNNTPIGTANGLRKSDGTLSDYNLSPGTSANIFWSADLTTQVVDGQNNVKVKKVNSDQTGFDDVLSTSGTKANGGSKAQPALAADVLGDHREELILGAGTTELRIYFNPEVSEHKLASLYTDRRYRVEVARQNTCYNQPSYTSFYYGPDMIWEIYADSIGVKEQSIDLTVSCNSIVETLAAYITVYVDANFEGEFTAYLKTGDELTLATPVVNGKARIYIPAAPAAGTCQIVVSSGGVSGSCDINVVAYNTNIWSTAAFPAEDGTVGLKFNAKVGLIGTATASAGAVSCKPSVTGPDTIGLPVAYESLEAGTVVSVKGVKLVELFPSYSFTYSAQIG